MNGARVKLNKALDHFVARNGGLVVRHKELEVLDDALLRPDVMYLNAIGLDIWTLDLKEETEQALCVWRDEHA